MCYIITGVFIIASKTKVEQEKYYLRVPILLGIGGWTDALDDQIIQVFLPVLALYWGLSPVEAGLLVSFGFLGRVISGIFSGIIVDLIGRRKSFIIGNLVTAFVMIMYILSPSFSVFLVARTLQGILSSWTSINNGAWIAEEAPPAKRQTWQSISGAISAVGIINTSVLLTISGLVPWFTWKHAFLYIAVVDLIAAVCGLFLHESRMWLRRRELLKSGKLREARVPLKKFLEPQIRKRFLLAAVLAAVGWFGLMFAPVPFMNYFGREVVKLSISFLGILGIITAVLDIFVRGIVGPISDRIGRLNVLIIFSIILIVGSNIFHRTPILCGTGETLTVMAFYTIFCIVYTSGFVAIGQTEGMWHSEIVPTGIRGSMQGFMSLIANIVGFFGSAIIGFISMYIGLMNALPMVSTIAAVIIILVALIAKNLGLETKGKILD